LSKAAINQKWLITRSAARAFNLYLSLVFKQGDSHEQEWPSNRIRTVKIRAASKSRVVVELAPEDAEFPPVPLVNLKLNRILGPVDFSEPSCKSFPRQSTLSTDQKA
jgi:hypothetical protein